MSITEALDKTAWYINSLDYVLIGNLTTVSVFVYLVVGILLKVEKRWRGERLVPVDEYEDYLKWKKEKECG